MPLFTYRPMQGGNSQRKAERPTLGGKGIIVEKPRGQGTRGLGRLGAKRQRKLPKDCILGITKGDIRRLARRGGVRRISGSIYNDIRMAIKFRLSEILKDCATVCDHTKRKTVTVTDVIFVLKRLGRPIYGFDKGTYKESRKPRVTL